MFQFFVRQCELIFCLLISSKCDLGEVEKEMFQLFERHCEILFKDSNDTLNAF